MTEINAAKRDITMFASTATDKGLMNAPIAAKHLPDNKEEKQLADLKEEDDDLGGLPEVMTDPELNNYNTGRGMLTSQPTDPDSGSKLRESSIDEVSQPVKEARNSGKSSTFKWFVILVLGIFAIISCYKLAEVVLLQNGAIPEEAASGSFTSVESPNEDETKIRDTTWSEDWPVLAENEFGEKWSETDPPYIALTGTEVIF